MTGFQAPKEANEISVPPYEGIGTHDGQELAPFDELPDLAFDVAGELLPQKEILGR